MAMAGVDGTSQATLDSSVGTLALELASEEDVDDEAAGSDNIRGVEAGLDELQAEAQEAVTRQQSQQEREDQLDVDAYDAGKLTQNQPISKL